MNFYSLYDSFDTFFKTFLRGNEVEFMYNNRHFAVLPIFTNDKKVVGVRIGESGCEKEQLCFSQEELFNFPIDGKPFGTLVEHIKIVWNNF